MLNRLLVLMSCFVCSSLFAASQQELQQEIQRLRQQNKTIQRQLNRLEHKVDQHTGTPTKVNRRHSQSAHPDASFHSSMLSVHTPESDPESIGFYPTALIADDHVVTYIAGTPIVASPYLGERPAFDGSDYIVNISSINRDIRLMQQRRRLYNAYQSIGYPIPNQPVIAISGKAEPVADYSRPFNGDASGDLNLGSSELDVAAMLNDSVEAFIGIAYDDSPSNLSGQRISNSAFNLNLGFVNIGDLDRTPFYFTAGQLYAPFGKYASSMISAPLTMVLARTKARPIIFGYKSQFGSGPYAAAYVFRSDTLLGSRAVGGVNGGYIYEAKDITADVGVGYIGALNDAGGMQATGSAPGTTFGGFGSITNGTELVAKRQGLDVHGNVSFDRYTIAVEWVGATRAFRPEDLSFNTFGAKPSAGQIEGGVTFRAFDKPASFSAGYQWSKNALALNLPRQRYSGVFNISIWKDTVESIEYRHDIDYGIHQFANGANAPGFTNLNTVGTGKSADTVVAQIGVYF